MKVIKQINQHNYRVHKYYENLFSTSYLGHTQIEKNIAIFLLIKFMYLIQFIIIIESNNGNKSIKYKLALSIKFFLHYLCCMFILSYFINMNFFPTFSCSIFLLVVVFIVCKKKRHFIQKVHEQLVDLFFFILCTRIFYKRRRIQKNFF